MLRTNYKYIALIVIFFVLVLLGIYYYSNFLSKEVNVAVEENEVIPLKEEIIPLVEQNDNPISEDLYEKCLKEEDIYVRAKCLLPHFREVTLKKDAITALLLSQKLETDGIIKSCHLPSHRIGNANFDKFNGDLGMSLSTCSPGEKFKYNACFEGCFHGVMERYVAQYDDLNDLMANISEVCGGIKGSSNPRTICMHGLGHGLVSHDITKVVESADLCRLLKDPSDFEPCLRGVFMENINNYLSLSEAKLRSKISSICEPTIATGNTVHTAICLQEIGYGLVDYTKKDFNKARDLCSPLSLEYRDECVNYVNLMEQDHKENPI